MAWAKSRPAAPLDLAASNLLACSLDDLPGARDALSLDGINPDGYPPLLDAIAAHYGVEAVRVMTGTGASGANLLAMAAAVSAGDHVLCERPFYDPIVGTARLLGTDVDFFERRFDTGYQLDLDALRARMTPQTRLVVLTNPHNPSGALLDDASIRGAAAVAAVEGATLLVDEAYLDIVNLLGEGRLHTPAALLAPNAISTSSLTKSYGLNALRCGWTVSSPALADRIRRARDVVDGIGAVPVDRLSVVAFAHLAQLGARARALVAGNLQTFRRWMADVPQLEFAAPVRATIAFPRVRGMDDTRTFADALFRGHGVAVVPGHFFGEPRNIRLSLAGRPDVLEEGLAALARALRG